MNTVRPPQALLRPFNALLRRIRKVPTTSVIISIDFVPVADDHGIEVIVEAGLPPSHAPDWNGHLCVVIPLKDLGFARREVERLSPLLRDRRYTDSLGKALLANHLAHFAAWLARVPPEYPRSGVCKATHTHYGLSLSSEPALLFFFTASAITEALGAVPKSALEQYLDLQGRLTRQDYPIIIAKYRSDPWLGDLTSTVRLRDLGLDEIGDALGDLLRRGTTLVDELGTTMLQSHTTDFGDFVAALPSSDYKALTMRYRHKHYGLQFDGDAMGFTLHLSAVRDAINEALSQAVTEGQNLIRV